MKEQNRHPRPSRAPIKDKIHLRDASIMGVSVSNSRPFPHSLTILRTQTNNSSIVSKRSVERLYFADEPHFFRYFVKKPQTRSPLINRGYWLRMQAVEKEIRQFLLEPSSKHKLVVNLGCG